MGKVIPGSNYVSISSNIGHKHHIHIYLGEKSYWGSDSWRYFYAFGVPYLTLMTCTDMMPNILELVWPVEPASYMMEDSIYSSMS